MKTLLLACLTSFLLVANSFAQQDSSLTGTWHLFKIIDNMTGDEILPPVDKPGHFFTLVFADSVAKYNLELNKCSLDYIITGKNEIKFPHYSECTLICCDKEFSGLLTYEDCTRYYMKNSQVLVLVSEERIFYFTRQKD